jgi:hypothetical protein
MNSLPAAKTLLERSRERTGLNELGDERFLRALEQLVQSINAESPLSPAGYEAAAERFGRLIDNRLRFEADLALNPEIQREPLLPPLVICGLPRVGSTKLHQLLARAGDFQSLLFWQGFNPARVQLRDADRDRQIRIEDAVRFLEWRSRRNPVANAAHYMAATEPEEDTYLLEYTLHTYWPVTYFEVSGFLRWLAGQDRDHAFGYVRRLLQYLQWQFHAAPHRPWVLKSPPNLGFEREMAHNLPGARFVMLHRDPVEVIPSTVAIVRELRRLYGESAGDLRKVGAWALEEYSAAMERHLAWRSSAPAGTVLDIAYTDVRDHYVEATARVYAHCGLTLTDAALQRMSGWAGDNEQHKHGVHRYTLDESGLSAELINSRFARYIELFGRYFESTA